MTQSGQTSTTGAESRVPGQWWWWSQIPTPLRWLFAVISCLAVLLPLIVSIITIGATAIPSLLIIKNAVWPSGPPPQRSDLPPPPGQQPPARTIVPGVFEGYVYYEVGIDGRPTDDGQLKLGAGGAMPAFWDIHPGTKLKAISPVNIRANPNAYNGWDNSGFNQVVGVLRGGECVQVVQGELRRYPVRIAASGGFLPVIRVQCN